MNRKQPFPKFNGVCRCCGRSFPTRRSEFFRPGGAKCPSCGGMLDPDKPLFKGTSSHHKSVRASKLKGRFR